MNIRNTVLFFTFAPNYNLLTMKIIKSILLLSAFALSANVNAQQGIYYYVNTNQNFINSKVTDVALNDNGLVILNQCSDNKYSNHAIQIIELNKSMVKTSENIIDVDNLYNICGFTSLSNGNYDVFTNIKKANYEPVVVTVSPAYKSLEQKGFDDLTMNSIVGFVTTGEKIMVLSTSSEAKGKYDIILSCFEVANGAKQWSKKISSEPNESADAIVADSENNVVVLGRKYNDNGSEYIPILYKIDGKGATIWKKSGVDMPSNFYSQTITIGSNGDIFYACGLTQRSGVLQTKIIKLDANGNTKRSSNLSEFTSNGALCLSSGKVLLYGSRFHTNNKQVVTKGAYVIVDGDLNELCNKALTENDKPDSDFNYSTTSSSDVQVAKELANGNIAMFGKVTMPQTGSKEKQNNTIVIVADAFGNY